jgi:hypothetical protein
VSPAKRSALGLARTFGSGRPEWMLVGEASLPGTRSVSITTREVESFPVDRAEVGRYVAKVMSALETYGSHRAATPGGASWLYVQHVPVRRLVAQLVRRFLALSAWREFAESPGPIAPAPYEGLIGLRDSSSREYRAYTVTWSGVAYALGGPAPHNPVRSARLRNVAASRQVGDAGEGLEPPALPRADVVALSWSSRHAETLMPVLEALAGEGRASVLVDLSTDPAECCGKPISRCVTVCRAPVGMLGSSGTVPDLGTEDDAVVHVAHHAVRLDRLERLAAALVEPSGGCTQPSWQAVVRMEAWLDGLLARVRPSTVLVSNDISPLGALAVHTAERHGATTVHIQHGAWIPETVAWPALHSRHLVVMGDRDAVPARAWARHPGAEIHVMGQPRFDALADLGRETQRRYLRNLLATSAERGPDRVVVWACQPFGPERLQAQAAVILDGVRGAGERWRLVMAPHPAQGTDCFEDLIPRDGELPVAVADPRVGARGCLAGADAVVSTSSTCGIEAVLLDVPVLELDQPGDRTLGLAESGAARQCRTAADITTALRALGHTSLRVPKQACDAVCRWSGSSAADIARLIIDRSQTRTARTDLADSTDHDALDAEPGSSQGEGATVR